jgi:hypothetical protein
MIEYDCTDEHSGQLKAETLPGGDPPRDGAVYWVWANPDAMYLQQATRQTTNLRQATSPMTSPSRPAMYRKTYISRTRST